MLRDDCIDCCCLTLIEDDWICDEARQKVEDVKECPEGVENTEE